MTRQPAGEFEDASFARAALERADADSDEVRLELLERMLRGLEAELDGDGDQEASGR